MRSQEKIAANARFVRQTLCDASELEWEKVSLGQESLKGLAKASLAVLVEMTQNCIAENARVAQDQGEYQISSEPQDFPACESLMHSNRYNGLVERYEKAKARFDEVTATIAQRSAKGERLAGFIRTLETQKEPVAEFDKRLWGVTVDYVTVGVDGGMAAVFRDGTGIWKNSGRCQKVKFFNIRCATMKSTDENGGCSRSFNSVMP